MRWPTIHKKMTRTKPRGALANGDPSHSIGLLLPQKQLDTPVELERVFLRQSITVGGEIRLSLPLRYQLQLARVAGLVQVVSHRLEPLARQLHVELIGAALVRVPA